MADNIGGWTVAGQDDRRERQEAVAQAGTWQSPSQLWQFPLLLASFGLFAVAGFFFIHPYHAPTFDEKLAVARGYLSVDRPDAAIEQLNRMLAPLNLLRPQEAAVHVLLGAALEAGQQREKISVPENFKQIIFQTQLGLVQGATADADVHRRLADSYAALGDTASAVDQYRQAIAMDEPHALNLRRKMIELLIDDQQTQPAMEAINEYLQQKELAAGEKSWALSQKADMLIDEHQFDAARKILADALKLTTDAIEEGELNYQLGYCDFKEGDFPAAERNLRLARDQMKESHPLDGDAAYYLGRIYQDRGEAAMAASLYQVTLVSHPESRVAPLALLGRGICRIMTGDTDAGLTDLHDLTGMIDGRPNRVVLKPQAIAGMEKAAGLLSDAKNYPAALEVMTNEQQLEQIPPALFYLRLGQIYEARATQLEQSGGDAAKTAPLVSEVRTEAGDAYVAYSRSLTLTDDKGYGDALWHGIDLYDSAGNLQRVIASLELFVSERPTDKLAPDALLRLGRAYQAAGIFDKAIDCFQRTQIRYPNSIAASKSAVPLAEAFVARGPDNYPAAEKVLLSVVEDNDLVDPSAEEFHQSLFELAQLYYRTQRYEPAISRLEEMAQRYPADQQLPQLTFLMADSYRKSAMLLDGGAAAATGSQEAIQEEIAAKRSRLGTAKSLFDKVLTLYATTPPGTDLDRLYQKLSTFYRADCMYDLGDYAGAVKLYQEAAFRYQDDSAALAAYVQIVNSYCAMGKMEDAKTANERAKWILRRMPAEAFGDGDFSMPKKYWDDWLKWTSASGAF